MVPALSSVLRTWMSGLEAAASFEIASPGLLRRSSGSRPACFALCTSKDTPTTAPKMPSTIKLPTMASIQTIGLVFFGPGGVPIGWP